MSIQFSCACGKTLKAPDGSEGRRAKCPKCGSIVTVPAPQPAALDTDDLGPSEEGEYGLSPDPTPRAAPSPRPALQPVAPVVAQNAFPSRPAVAPAPALHYPLRPRRSWRSFSYILLLLTLIPLIISTIEPSADIDQRIGSTIAAHPELKAKIKDIVQKTDTGEENIDPEALFSILPDHRLDGALLSRESEAHWLIALVAATGFFVLLLFAFSNALKYAKGLIFAGIFTGTVGILLLLLFQWAAFSLPWFAPRSVIGIVLLIVKLIGMSYALAETGKGFILSFLGFTFGVGLCEETTKVLPLLFRIKSSPGQDEATWNTLLIWGLASGIGFGIAEGIMYSGRSYNGIEGLDIYLVRFISCVGLHAMWAGAVGVTLYNRQGWLHEAANNWMYCFYVAAIVFIPMTLHGLYDTLLKFDHDGYALIVALASFGWLTFQIERMWRKPAEIVSY